MLPTINIGWRLGNIESTVIVLVKHLNGFLVIYLVTHWKQNTNIMYKETCRRKACYFQQNQIQKNKKMGVRLKITTNMTSNCENDETDRTPSWCNDCRNVIMVSFFVVTSVIRIRL